MWHLIVLLIAACGVIYGFRRGLARQTPSMIGMAFGIISARLLAPGLVDVVDGAFPSIHGNVEEHYVCDTISSTIVFASIYLIFRTVTGFLGRVMNAAGEHTILNNLGGAVYSLFKYLMFTSIALNLLVAMRLNADLLHSVKSDDGNIVEGVMLLSPGILGGQDIEELSHLIQLREAKKIS